MRAFALGQWPDGIYDRVEHKYNRQGEVKETKDQNGTVHALDHNKLGRRTQDRVITLGAGIDGAVRRLARAYEVRGLLEKVTSHDNPSVGAGNVVNEVQFGYNSFGQLVIEYQEHGGAVSTSITPKVQYAYADGSANTVRPTSVTYPDGRQLDFDYGTAGAIDDAASRIRAIKDGTLGLVQYAYLGQVTFVEADYTEPDVEWTVIDLAGNNDPDTGDIYRSGGKGDGSGRESFFGPGPSFRRLSLPDQLLRAPGDSNGRLQTQSLDDPFAPRFAAERLPSLHRPPQRG